METDRLRLVFEENDGPIVRLTGVEALGPPQVNVRMLRPYWHGWHVWYPEPPERVLAEPRYFRATFDLREGETFDSAFVQLHTSDGLYEVYVNGTRVADGLGVMPSVNVTADVHSGRNCPAVKVTPTGKPIASNMTMTCDLTLNTNQGTRYVTTDDSWHVARQVTDDWMMPTYDAGDWSAPLMIARVSEVIGDAANAFQRHVAGGSLDGRLAYTDCAVHQRVTVRSVEVRESHAKPGDMVTVRLHLRPDAPLMASWSMLLMVSVMRGGSFNAYPCILAGGVIQPVHGD